MTEQIPDTCRINGKTWNIETWNGNDWVLPTADQLWRITKTEIDLVVDSTANWSGIINHFVVVDNKLYLFKVEVSLDNSDKADEYLICEMNETYADGRHTMNTRPDYRLPEHYRIEEITLFQPCSNSLEMEKEEKCNYWVTHIRRILFEDLHIPFTGKLTLSWDDRRGWEYPETAQADDGHFESRVLEFKKGVLIS